MSFALPSLLRFLRLPSQRCAAKEGEAKEGKDSFTLCIYSLRLPLRSEEERKREGN